MACNISEIRKQLEAMQELFDTYEHCHVDSVTPEEKIVERVKAKCIEAVKSVPNFPVMHLPDYTDDVIKAIQGID